ncbi:MAG: C40 family peptidase [Hymenobacteraceae bacterium]|nr:C40 family peptidase [Hymenobacteraceae bacterium]MDX5397997.1 C40 family peptidase [Hymenobacteraceae bacterium]MDX5514069.1 C40 family peptidase [Hymenobacteraceae bacterium]
MSTLTKLSSFFLLISLVWFSSCQNGKVNYRDGQYYSAQEMAKMKQEERRTRRAARKAGLDPDKAVAKKTENKGKSRHKIGTIADPQVQKVISTARSYRGTPYKWGGTTRLGMDCSGLLCTSFQSIDVSLPRTSQEQSEFGPNIKLKDIKPGDLVFFGANRFSREITHVGLVTEVHGSEDIRFIHSSTSLGVVEDNLFSEHYQKIFIKAVRPRI